MSIVVLSFLNSLLAKIFFDFLLWASFASLRGRMVNEIWSLLSRSQQFRRKMEGADCGSCLEGLPEREAGAPRGSQRSAHQVGPARQGPELGPRFYRSSGAGPVTPRTQRKKATVYSFCDWKPRKALIRGRLCDKIFEKDLVCYVVNL